MIADKIQLIGREYRDLRNYNAQIRWSKGIKDSKSEEVKIDRENEIAFLKDICDREGVSFKAITNILMIK